MLCESQRGWHLSWVSRGGSNEFHGLLWASKNQYKHGKPTVISKYNARKQFILKDEQMSGYGHNLLFLIKTRRRRGDRKRPTSFAHHCWALGAMPRLHSARAAGCKIPRCPGHGQVCAKRPMQEKVGAGQQEGTSGTGMGTRDAVSKTQVFEVCLLSMYSGTWIRERCTLTSARR